LEPGCVSVVRQRSVHHTNSNLLRYASENKSNFKGSNWKLVIEKLKINYKAQKNRTRTSPQVKNHKRAMN
jgi:hypothetical protein